MRAGAGQEEGLGAEQPSEEEVTSEQERSHMVPGILSTVAGPIYLRNTKVMKVRKFFWSPRRGLHYWPPRHPPPVVTRCGKFWSASHSQSTEHRGNRLLVGSSRLVVTQRQPEPDSPTPACPVLSFLLSSRLPDYNNQTDYLVSTAGGFCTDWYERKEE